jgi:pimeloyl-ACP methyl ester carboxylesterase
MPSLSAVKKVEEELHYTSYGSGPPLVLVHGLAGSTRWWRRNIQALSPYFKVFLVDLPGFGLSGKGKTLEELRGVLPLWLDLMGLDCVHLVGHSMGGYLAINLAAMYPERIQRLCLIDAVGVPIRARLGTMMGRVINSIQHSSLTFIPTVISDGLRAGIPHLISLTREIVEVDARPMLPKIEATTLILWGTRDVITPPQLGLEMAETIPNATFRFVPRAGHNAMADRPKLVNEYLLEFFYRQTLPRP